MASVVKTWGAKIDEPGEAPAAPGYSLKLSWHPVVLRVQRC